MQRAIGEMQSSRGSGPMVGAVLVRDNSVLGVGHREPGVHAERAAIEAVKASGGVLSGATLYTTLEPCINLGSATTSCADLISQSGITSVVIGRYDTNPRIYREGWKLLRDCDVHLRDFDPDLRAEIDTLNAEFREHFICGKGPSDGAKFDFLLNGGNFEIQYSEDDKRSVVTRWTLRDRNSIYAYANRPLKVALARHARLFSEIDDPTALDGDYHTAVNVGEIAVFVGDTASVLVKVVEVHSGPDYGSDHTSVKVEFEVRPYA
jgi:diaminohydroxyphosphoribosylaminopyrimidine deaminase / 5-amino-6-(5-phosphoribosylamino)uracil reductase